MVLEHYNKDTVSEYSNPQSAQVQQRISKGKENEGKVVTKGLNIKKKSSQESNGIEANFNKALAQQNDEFTEVTNFLANIKMEKYKDVFIDNGIEDRETILELNESHLEEMGLPLGHKLKIMKKIKEEKKKEAPRVIQPTVKKTAEASATTAQASNSLLDGEYDEEANKREFQEALNAWRKTGTQEQSNADTPVIQSDTSSVTSKSKTKKSVRFAEAPPEELLILNDDEENKEDDQATEIKPIRNKPSTEIREGMIAFKGLSISKKSFLFSEEATGSTCWNVDLMSTVDHASTSPRETTPIVEKPKKIDKELCNQ